MILIAGLPTMTVFPMLVKNGGISYLLKVHKNILLSYNVLQIILHGCSLIIGIYDIL